jgi:tripartite-type tricarboxylate transporter receptor subunit TctC
MNLPRRQFLHLAAGAAALPAVSRIARAQTYPGKPVRVIVPFAAGGNTDLIARMIGQWLSERLGQPFIIETRPGAGTNIGTEAAVRAPADGYTLLIVAPPSAINATLYEKLNFNFIRDIVPIAGVIRAPFVVEVNPSVPTKTVPEFIAYAKTQPGRISMGSAGIGSGPHLAGGAPKNTPREIVDKLNKEINAALANPKIKAQLADLGGTVLPGSPADFGKLIADDTEKWGKVIRAAHITAE